MVETKFGDFYDLHTHSSVSDGTTTPTEIASEVLSAGLAGFSLTDHDTTDGWDEARTAATQFGVDFLPGLEMTTNFRGRSIHLLGYGVDSRDERLREELTTLVNSRHERAKIMIERLRRDFLLDWDSVLEPVAARGRITVGRPHLADALVGAGFFATRSEVFEGVLSTRSQYYVPTYATETSAAIALVREAGGFPVLAHPAAFRMRKPVDASAIELFAAQGLGGIELRHPENREDWLPPIREVAERQGLLVTGSSDYHGVGKPNRLGEQSSPASAVETIRAQVASPR